MTTIITSHHWGVNHLFRNVIANTENEEDFLDIPLELRLKYPTNNNGDMESRVGAWQHLLNDHQWDMHVDLSEYCYIP
ncbi:hypothetical protein AAFM79_04610 [Trichormus azollae HNT15244]